MGGTILSAVKGNLTRTDRGGVVPKYPCSLPKLFPALVETYLQCRHSDSVHSEIYLSSVCTTTQSNCLSK